MVQIGSGIVAWHSDECQRRSLRTLLSNQRLNDNYDRNRANCAWLGHNLRGFYHIEIDHALRNQRRCWIVDSLCCQLSYGHWNRLQLAGHLNLWNRRYLRSDIGFSTSLHRNRILNFGAKPLGAVDVENVDRIWWTTAKL